MTNVLLRSFAGGEITPEMYGQVNNVKYQTGLALARNFLIAPHGPAKRRAGTSYVAEARDSDYRVRLIPFQFNTEQAVVLEFGHLTLRFHVAGQQLLEADKDVVEIVGSTVTVANHGWSTGDDVYIGGRSHRITATGEDTFTTADRWGNATTPTGSTAARVYTIATPYDSAYIFGLHYTQDSDVLTIVSPEYEAHELRRLGATNWTLTPISFAPTLTPPSGVSVTPTVGTPGNQNPQKYCVTVVDTDGVTESLRSSVVSTSNNLTVSGNYNTVQCNSTAGLRYNFYKSRGGAFGYIGQVLATGATVSIVDDNVTPDTLKTPPEDIFDLNTGPGDYPRAVTYYEQRRWFAGTIDEPQTVWATRNGTEANFTSSVPSQDDDGLKFRIRAQQQNAIRHLMPLSDLIALTVGGEFRIFSDGAPAITPTSLSTKPQGFSGASDVQPALTSGSILYVQAQQSRIRELAYNWQSNAYASVDVSILAPHLFDGYTIVDVAYSRSPVPTMWCVRDDGKLLAMTYVPEQQVYAWHQHETRTNFFANDVFTGSTIESVCVVSESAVDITAPGDVLYLVVRRFGIDGRAVRYIERLEYPRSSAFTPSSYVDCSVIYDGTPTTTLSNLWHLEGQLVDVNTNGAVHPRRTVVNGEIELDYEASLVRVGLRYASDMQTLPIAAEIAAAAAQGITKNVNGVAIRVADSMTVQAGPSFEQLVEYPARDVSDPYDSPPALKTGELRFDLPPDWNSDGAICIRQDDPLPLTVLSIAPDVAVGG